MNSTIIFYTSNREKPEFEKKIVEDLVKKAGDIPIISVSQKPMDLGTNICVGDVGTSGFNVCRQIQMACRASKTPFVITAEADCIYPPDYFTFVPPRLDVPYRNTNIYVQKYKGDFVCKKDSSLFAQIVGREFFLERLDELFGDLPQWDSNMKNFPKEVGKRLFDRFEYFETEYGCISFKTGQGLRKHSTTNEIKLDELPYWGKISDVRRQFEAN